MMRNTASSMTAQGATVKDKCSDMIYKSRCVKSLNTRFMVPVLEYYAMQDIPLTPATDPMKIAQNVLRQGGLLCTLLNEYRGNTIDADAITGIPTDGSLREDMFTNEAAKANLRQFVRACSAELFFSSDELFDPEELFSENLNVLSKALAFTDKFFDKIKRVKGIKFDKLIAAMKETEEQEAAARRPQSDYPESAVDAPVDKRLRAIEEILTSERAFVADLDYLFRYYEELKIDRTVPVDVLKGIFTDFDKLFNFQQRYSYAVENTITPAVLQSVQASYGSQAGQKLFVAYEDQFEVYMGYVANLPRARELVKENMAALMQKQHQMDPQGQLDSFLIKPTQRLCKYPLLIREVIRNSAADAADLAEWREAYDAADRNAARVNELLQQGDNDVEAERMRELVVDWTAGRTKIDRDSLGPLLRYEKLVYIKESGNGSEVTLYLFEHMLLMCRPGKSTIRSRPSLAIKWSAQPHVQLRFYEDTSRPADSIYAFKIYSEAGQDLTSVSFTCRNAESVKLWAKAFRRIGMEPQEHLYEEPPAEDKAHRGSMFNRRPKVAAVAAGNAQGPGQRSSVYSTTSETLERPLAASVTGLAPVSVTAAVTAEEAFRVKLVYGSDAYIVLVPHAPSLEQLRKLALKTIRTDFDRRHKPFTLSREEVGMKYVDDVQDLINITDEHSLCLAWKHVTPGRLAVHLFALADM